MANVRVFSLARDLNLTSQEVTERLKQLGVEVKTASSSVDEDTADKLKRAVKIDAEDHMGARRHDLGRHLPAHAGSQGRDLLCSKQYESRSTAT